MSVCCGAWSRTRWCSRCSAFARPAIGLAFEDERNKDPLLSFCEDFARLRARSAEHGRELAIWTDALFTEPGANRDTRGTPFASRRCLISDVGWRAHPDYRGEQSLNLIAHSALSGIDHPGRLFLQWPCASAMSAVPKHRLTSCPPASGV